MVGYSIIKYSVICYGMVEYSLRVFLWAPLILVGSFFSFRVMVGSVLWDPILYVAYNWCKLGSKLGAILRYHRKTLGCLVHREAMRP